MADTISVDAIFNIPRLPPPTGIADYVAIAIVGAASAAYLLRGIVWNRPDPYHHVWFRRPSLRGGAAGTTPATRNIAQKLEESGHDVIIFWGSQSGTAETLTHRLAKECYLRFGLPTLAADLNYYDSETFPLIPKTKLAILILSTYGEGDPSDNTSAFWEWLHKHEVEIKLPNLRYVALGLGNSNYRYYNRVVDVVAEALDKAGAQRLMPVGKANDANGDTNEDFLGWKDSLFQVFLQDLGLEERNMPYEPALTVVEDESLSLIDLHLGEPLGHHSRSVKSVKAFSPIRPLTIQGAQELYSSPSRHCLHMELDISEHSELRYRTGDHLAVYPINPDQEVQLLLRALGLEARADKPLLIQPIGKGEGIKIPSPTTLSALFRHYLEVSAPVSRDIVGTLSRWAPTPEAASLLASLGKNKDAYAEFVSKNHVTIGRILSISAPNAVWKALPIAFLVESIPPIQPRYYSISSSSAITAKKVSITVGINILSLAGEASKEIHGVTTNYLYALSKSLNKSSLPSNFPLYALSGPNNALEGHKVYAYLCKSAFKLPTLSSTPLIMVAAGTGIAPFRGFILERARLREIGKPVGRMLLFFGCRHPSEDFLYKDELVEMARVLDGSLEIVPAFSRQHHTPKTYIQEKIADKSSEVCELLGDGANMYICGRASMAREVGKVLERLMKDTNGWDDLQTRSWAAAVKKGGKWLEDVWG